jgi:BlaI family transcriptional regulator, penicillinase repressor
MTAAKRKKQSIPSPSNAEWEVMKVLWEKGPMVARDVYDALPSGHGWAVKTMKTLLSRLVAKGALEYQQVGNAYLYRARFSREEMTRKEVKGFIRRVLDNSLAPILAHFIEERDSISDEEVSRLRALLNDRKGTSGRKERQVKA